MPSPPVKSGSRNSTPPDIGGHEATGGKFPRRVQWLDDRAGEQPSQSPAHLLDEYGLDLEAFERLTESLEQYRRAAPLGQIHYYPPQSPVPSSSSEVSTEGDTTAVETLSEPETFGTSSSIGSSNTFNDSSTALPTHDVPDNYIDPDESAGLPGTKDLRSYARKKAARLIQAHLRTRPRRKDGSGFTNRRAPRRKSGTSTPGGSGFTSEEDSDWDIEKKAGQSPRGSRGGLLSAILDLYEHPSTPSSGYSSGISSGTQTPSAWSESFTDTDGQTSPHAAQEKRKEKQKKGFSTSSIPIPGKISRPAKARTSGGVFGPLIASTGNLAGLAAPIPSRLQPNLKRSGYQLSRYSLDCTPTLDEPLSAMVRNRSDEQRVSPLPDNIEPPPPTPPPSPTLAPAFYPSNWPEMIKELPGSIKGSFHRGSAASSPMDSNEKQKEGGDKGRKHKKRKRIKSEVYITRHVAKIIQREEFLLKLTRAMMMFGGPSHRLQAQLQSAARVLDIELNLMYLPDTVLLSFDDSSTGTSHIRMIRQASSLDLGKLDDAYHIYWKVIHDQLSVSDASIQLDALMRKKPLYNWWQSMLIGGMCSGAICTVSFSGSFIDALMSFPLGALLVAVQILSTRNVLYSYVFEVTITTLFSFVAAALAATHQFCYSAIASSSVVLILPGFLVLTGSLELMSRHLVSGSVRICYAVVYALFLGFGFTIGAQLYEIFTDSKVYGAENYDCSMTHNASGDWYQRTPSKIWAFLTVPMFSTFLSMKNQAPYNRKELYLLVGIACIGWVTNYFTGTRFVNQSDISAAVGAFAVGLVSNVYARIFSGNAFVIMITGILFQLPSGLGSGGLLSYASEQTSGSSTSYISGFRTALKLVSVAIGLAIGLGLSLSLAHPIQSKKREAGIFSL